MLQLAGDTQEVRLAAPAAWDGIAERQSTTAGAGTKPSPAHTHALSCPADPSLARQGSGTAEDTAEQQLLGLPQPEHPSALPSAALFSHLSLAKLQKTALTQGRYRRHLSTAEEKTRRYLL